VFPFVANGPEEMWKKLHTLKTFSPEGIPTTLGGHWRYDKFEAWLKNQQRKGGASRSRYNVANLTAGERLQCRQVMKRRMDELAVKSMLPVDHSKSQDSNATCASTPPELPAEIVKSPPVDYEEACAQITAAMSSLSIELTNSYRQACEKAPDIVKKESNPVCFLQHEKGDAKLAALRLCRYWKARCNVLTDRAFLSLLDLSGKGALGPKEIEFLNYGSVVRLPKDEGGSSVICVDRTVETGRLRSAKAQELRQRCLFYQLGVLSTDSPSSQQEPAGAILLYVVNDNDRVNQYFKEGSALDVIGAFPVHIARFLTFYFLPLEVCQKAERSASSVMTDLAKRYVLKH
jgi:hypothetical protein